MSNDSVFSGVTAHPAREVADLLHGRDWDSNNWDFLALVGAVTTLAREVDRITPRVVEHDEGPRPMGPLYSEPFASPLPSFEHGMRALDSEAKLRERLALVYAGLADMRRLCALGAGPGTPEHARAAEAAVIAIHARLSAMLEAAGKGRAEREARAPLPSPIPPLMPPDQQLALVYEGLREVLFMAKTGETSNAPRSYLTSIAERLRAMLDAGGAPHE
jgi:hypothetical protein